MPKLVNEQLLDAVQNDETIHDNELKRVSIRAEIGYWLFQATLVSNIVITSLASSNYFSHDIDRNLDISSAALSALSVFLGHLNRTNFSRKGVMSAISKSYPVLKQNLSQALSEDSAVDAHVIFNQIENNAKIIKDIGKVNINLSAPETRPFLLTSPK